MEPRDIFDIDEPILAAESPKGSAKASPKVFLQDEKNIATNFRHDLLKWLVEGKTEPPRAPGLHCSSLWKTCPRVPLLEAKYAQYIQIEDETAGGRMTFDVGHALHDLIQNNYLGPFGRLWGKWKCLACQKVTHEGTMPEACPKCDIPWRDEADGIQNILYAELFVKDDQLKYCGHCDGIVLTREGNKVVFEFKTISPSQYRGLKAPKHEHVVQVHAYMNALGLKSAIILYWDKGSQADWRKGSDGRWTNQNPHLKVFHVCFDDDLWKKMSKRILDYHAAVAQVKKLPTIEIEHIKKHRRICSHKKCALAGECHVRDLCFAI